jgi:hypothetical protein
MVMPLQMEQPVKARKFPRSNAPLKYLRFYRVQMGLQTIFAVAALLQTLPMAQLQVLFQCISQLLFRLLLVPRSLLKAGAHESLIFQTA